MHPLVDRLNGQARVRPLPSPNGLAERPLPDGDPGLARLASYCGRPRLRFRPLGDIDDALPDLN